MSALSPAWHRAFAHPVTAWITLTALGLLLFAMLAIAALSALGRLSPELRRELWLRVGSWSLLIPAMLLPVLAGRPWTIGAETVLALLCFGEYARATGLFREHLTCAVTVAGILAVNFASLDHWYGFFVALWPLAVGVIAVASIPMDRPEGYIQRTALGILGYMLFGVGLAHLGYMANDPGYRPIVLLLLLGVGLNDVAAFVCGKLLGGPKLLPRTSPNKTRSGAVGALVITTLLVGGLAQPVFAGTPLDHPVLLAGLGAIVSVAGQLGDLTLSSIKRDLGIKDMGAAIPGHGGILDRFNSLLLVSPAVFHYVGYYVGFGLAEPSRLITGG